MKAITKTVWETSDGTEFLNKKEAKHHEIKKQLSDYLLSLGFRFNEYDVADAILEKHEELFDILNKLNFKED